MGLALLFPSDDLVLPSLWEAVAGTPEITWSQRDAEGRFLDFSPEFGRVWRWKDELPERRLVCAGKHVGGGRSALVSLRVLPALVAVARTDDLDPLELELVQALDEHGPLAAPELARVAGRERRRVTPSLDRLQRKLVVTGAGAQERRQGWPAVVLDLVDRRYPDMLRRLPRRDDALSELAVAVLRHAREVSAADVAAAVGCRVAEAETALAGLERAGDARRREEERFALWTAKGRRR